MLIKVCIDNWRQYQTIAILIIQYRNSLKMIYNILMSADWSISC